MCADCVAIALTAADMDSRRSAVDAVAPLPRATRAAPVPDGGSDGRVFTVATLVLVKGRTKSMVHEAWQLLQAADLIKGINNKG